MHRGKDAAAGHQFISAGICSSVVRARRSAIEEETNFHEQHRSPEHIHAMPAGSHAIHGFKAYTAAAATSGRHGWSSMKPRRDDISQAGQ
jgi:hypothetical protein